MTTPITVAHGNGIGPEIMTAVLKILDAAGAKLTIDTIEIGETVYNRGINTGIEASAWQSLRNNHVFLKAPVTTPQGGGFKSLNVTIRKTLGLYANVRPCISYSPYIKTKHPYMNVVIVRENEEGLYGGIEYQQTPQMAQSLKLVSEPGCERIIRYAFEYARQNNRRKVTAFSKDNIMKLTDGMFHRCYDRVTKDYTDIETEHWIIDIGAAKLADKPEQFDVIVLQNLYGDILSDVAAEISGSVGMCGSSNIGESCAMFEAIHGSAPDIAGQDIANPSGLLHGAIMMLVHIYQRDVAENIHNAWLKTIEDGMHTGDIYNSETSKEKLGTQAFADAVITRLGQRPQKFHPANYNKTCQINIPTLTTLATTTRELVGVDLFIYASPNSNINDLAATAQDLADETFTLEAISNRGAKVWPDGIPETFCTDHWRLRFVSNHASSIAIAELLHRCAKAQLDVIKTENLYTFDGQAKFT
ncbi:MAG: NADP-dependent isocitrate dehydrogenase [Gammaproteobacteria bacterium]|nr:NADP-dependent isocitrate dehydrogenase [Gammaproteobacteria bacterium]